LFIAHAISEQSIDHTAIPSGSSGSIPRFPQFKIMAKMTKPKVHFFIVPPSTYIDFIPV
jgi:hypothetical protein